MAEDGYPVKLHIYDVSQGMARQLSATILGKAIEAIWHTGVVVYGREYYFGGGIQQGQPGRTPYGAPIRVETLGVTHHPKEVFEDFLQKIGPRYTPANYNLLSNNCNNFSNEVAQFLAGAAVPSYILELPKEVMNSPVGKLILPMIQGLETSLRAGAVPQPPQFRPAPAPVAVFTTATQPSAKDVEEKSTAVDKPEECRKPAINHNADGSAVAPPAVQPAAPPAAAAQTHLSANDVEARSSTADKPEEAGKTAVNSNNDGSTVAPAPAAAAQTQLSANDVEATSTAADEPEEAGKTAVNGNDNGSTVAPPTAPPAAAAQVNAAPAAVATKAAPPDPLAEAKSRVQEEIKREFAAIMASGTARAGEAAALAMRRVMERHGLQRAAVAVAPPG